MDNHATQLTCPNCQTTIPAENINIQKTLALCPNCGVVFNFGEANQPTTTPKIKRRKAKKPESITVTESSGQLDIAYASLGTRSNKIGLGFLMLIVFLVWLILSVLMISEAEYMPALIFSLIFGAAEIVTWLLFLNRTHIILDETDLKSVTRPLSSGNISLNRDDIVDVTYEPTTSMFESATTSSTFSVMAVRYDGQKRLLQSGLQEEYAAYISQELARHIREDRTETAINNLDADRAEYDAGEFIDLDDYDEASQQSSQSNR